MDHAFQHFQPADPDNKSKWHHTLLCGTENGFEWAKPSRCLGTKKCPKCYDQRGIKELTPNCSNYYSVLSAVIAYGNRQNGKRKKK